MELKERYIFKIYEEKSISAAAKKLFISQPALSATLSKQEKLLGFKIFDRSSSPLSLTEKGRIYIEHLHEVLQSETQMKQKIKQLSYDFSKYLSVGGTFQIVYHLVPLVCKELQRKYPDTVINIDMGNNLNKDYLIEKLSGKTIDIVFSLEKMPQFECIPLITEEFLIGMHKSMAEENNLLDKALTKEQIINRTYSEKDEFSDFTQFKNVKFLLNNMFISNSKFIEKMMQQKPKISSVSSKNTKNLFPQYNLMRQGFGAMLVSDLHISLPELNSDELVYFVPKEKFSTRTPYLLLNKERPENLVVNEFVSLAKELVKKLKYGN